MGFYVFQPGYPLLAPSRIIEYFLYDFKDEYIKSPRFFAYKYPIQPKMLKIEILSGQLPNCSIIVKFSQRKDA